MDKAASVAASSTASTSALFWYRVKRGDPARCGACELLRGGEELSDLGLQGGLQLLMRRR